MKEKTVNLGEGLTVTVKKLNRVRDVYDWIEGQKNTPPDKPVDIVGDLILEDCPLETLAMMCDATIEAIKDMTMDQVERLASACKEMNPHFFRVALAWNRIRQGILLGTLSGVSNGGS